MLIPETLSVDDELQREKVKAEVSMLLDLATNQGDTWRATNS